MDKSTLSELELPSSLMTTLNEIIILETSFEEKLRKLCSNIARQNDMVITFTSIKRKEVTLISSEQVEHVTPALTEEEYKKHCSMQDEFVMDLTLHEQTKKCALQKGCTYRHIFPIFTAKREAIGYFLAYCKEAPSRIMEHFSQVKMKQVIQLLHKISTYEQQIKMLQTTDTATKLPSYQQFTEQLNYYKQQGSSGVIKIIEPGEFSKILGLYGRSAGEELLRQLGKRLMAASVSKNSEIARFTSSALIMFSPVDFEALRQRTSRISDDVVESFTIFGHETPITLKVGIAPFDINTSVHDAIRFAEYALAKARQTHGAQTEFYTEHYDDALDREMKLLNLLNTAIQNKEITAFFQPKYAVYNEKIMSMEALARWISPELGFVSPAEFIPVAENAGLIKDLELQIIEQVLRWQQQRQYDGKRIVPIAVNISPDHFYHPQFIENLQRLITQYYADPKFLSIEVTENMGLFDFERAKHIISTLQSLGVMTSIDDFGVGYSSLSYLQKFPFNELKIDRSFILKLHELGTQTIVKAIIEIAHTLDMYVIAEGVETEDQLAILKAIRCDGIQGYYYSKPLPIEQASQLIDKERKNRNFKKHRLNSFR